MKKIISALLIILLLLILAESMSFAMEPYPGYNYNSWGDYQPVPNAYEPVKVIGSSDLGISPMVEPSDIVYHKDKIFILDSGNGRIIVLDTNYKWIKTIENFTMPDGQATKLAKPLGLFISGEDKLIIADTDAGRVLLCNQDGKVETIYQRPESDIYPENLDFKPYKVLSDKQDNIYVLCKGFYYGAVIYDSNGRFAGFFGANRVEVSLAQVSDIFWRKLMTKTQKNYLSKYVPIDYTSFDIDREDFIYTCSKTQSSMNEIKKLNAMGSDILTAEVAYDPLNKKDYGEKERIWYNGNYLDTNFIDVDISDNGMINALDYTYGKIFQYDQDSNLLCIFGGISDQKGMFKIPAAIESVGSDILVLDSEKAVVTVFGTTEYGKSIHEATILYSDGYYTEALSKWQSLLRQNSNSELAYRGIGRAYLQQSDYSKAMQYLKLGQDRSAYSKAFGYYRTGVVRNNFGWIASALLLLLLVLLFWKWIARKINKPILLKTDSTKGLNPFSVMIHPLEGMDSVRLSNGRKSVLSAVAVVTAWFVISILDRQGTGFIFNLNRPQDLNVLLIIGKTFGVFLLFVICNYAVGTLNEGEGTFRKVFTVSAYALMPYIITLLIRVLGSNIIIYQEGVLLDWLVVFGLLFSMFMLFSGVSAAHQYSVSKTILSLLLTLIVIMIVLFILILVFSLIQQLYIFAMTIYNELMFRM